MENICTELGGSVSVYTKKDTASVSDTLVSLYGAANTAPDELSLVDFGIIWYSKSISGGDGAVFYVTNTADRESVEKMCSRRQKTVKRTTGTDMTVYSSGHYVCLYSEGLPPLERAICKIIEK